MANLSYIKNFRFSQSAKDDLSYCLTSFEAAVEFISQGNLRQGRPVRPGDPAHALPRRVPRTTWFDLCAC